MYLFKKIVYNCKHATQLSLKKEEGKASFRERVQLWYHLLYCSFCRRCIRQSRQINEMGQELKHHLQQNPPFRLSPESREKIRERLGL